MIRAALRRIAIISGALLGVILVVSIVLGLLAGTSIARAVSLGFYLAGAVMLIGCFVLGSRGPLRPQWGEGGRPPGAFLPRGVRRASDEERRQSVRESMALFAVGIVLVVIGTFFDPTRRAF